MKQAKLSWREGLEVWEKPLLAAALYFVDPRPEQEVMQDIAELIGRGESARIASLVWRIAFGEGYTHKEWTDLLKSLTILSPWKCIWRFQELVEEGLRKKHSADPYSKLRDRDVLREACKLLGTG